HDLLQRERPAAGHRRGRRRQRRRLCECRGRGGKSEREGKAGEGEAAHGLKTPEQKAQHSYPAGQGNRQKSCEHHPSAFRTRRSRNPESSAFIPVESHWVPFPESRETAPE